MLATGIAYYVLTEDTPDDRSFAPRKGMQAMREAMADYRVWLLFLLYGACFGIEITVDNVAALYFIDAFHTSLKLASLLSGMIGMMRFLWFAAWLCVCTTVCAQQRAPSGVARLSTFPMFDYICILSC